MKKLQRKLSLFAYRVMLPIIRVAVRGSTRVYVALIYNGKVLLVKNLIARDNWRLPGGGIAHGEPLEDAAVRELHEELGVELDPEKLLPINEGKINSDKLAYHYVNFAYVLSNLPEIKPNRLEISDYDFFRHLPADSHESLATLFKDLKEEKLL